MIYFSWLDIVVGRSAGPFSLPKGYEIVHVVEYKYGDDYWVRLLMKWETDE